MDGWMDVATPGPNMDNPHMDMDMDMQMQMHMHACIHMHAHTSMCTHKCTYKRDVHAMRAHTHTYMHRYM
jgi:hypothetical protein